MLYKPVSVSAICGGLHLIPRQISKRNVTFIQFNICCCVQNFIKIRWLFAEIWPYNDFQNGGRPPSWNCFATIRDHPRSLFCWPQLPVKFHVNLIHRSEDIAIWIFRIFDLKCLFVSPKWGLWTPKCDYSSSRPQKAHHCMRKSASYKLSTVKIRWGVWPVGELTESVTDTHTDTHTGKFMFCPCIVLDRQKVKWPTIPIFITHQHSIMLTCDTNIAFLSDYLSLSGTVSQRLNTPSYYSFPSAKHLREISTWLITTNGALNTG